jgi:hypothetical protein
MNEDRLLRDLADQARREGEAGPARLDERWDRLAAGTLTAREDAELKALAASSPEAREAYEAFRPLGADFQARVLSAIQAEKTAAAPRTAPPEPRPRVLPFRRAAVRRVEGWLGVVAAVAAGLFFFLRTPAALPPLPGYALEFPHAAQSEYRGSDSQPATPGSLVPLKVRADTAVKGEVKTQGFLSCGGGDLRPWRLTRSSDNPENGVVVDLQGTLDKGTPPGFCEIWIVVFRPGKAPSDFPAEWRAGRTGNADWRAVHAKLPVKASSDP